VSGEMDDNMRCPMFDIGVHCSGTLKKIGGTTTYMGIIHGVDNNVVTEKFKCDVCGKEVEREWKWAES